MTRTLGIKLVPLLALALVALAAVAGAAAATKEYVPFATDFPKGVAPVEPYRPFATDFAIGPRPAGGTVVIAAKAAPPAPASPGRQWDDVALGGLLGIAFVVGLGSAVLAARRLGWRGGGGSASHAGPPAARAG